MNTLPSPNPVFVTPDTLRAHDGRCLTRIQWLSPLHKAAALATEDPEYATEIACAVHMHFGPNPPDDVTERIVGLAPYLPVVDKITPALFDEQSESVTGLCAALRRITSFPPVPTSGPIVVVHSDHGGGSRIAADSFVTMLRDFGDDAVVLDLSAVSGRVDPLRVAFGMGEHELWNQIMADRGDPQLLSEYTRHVSELSDFAPGNTVAALKTVILPLRPRAIVCCTSGFPRLVQLARCGAPIAIYHTDFQLNAKLLGDAIHPYFKNSFSVGISLLEIASPARLAVWLASPDPKSEAVLSPDARRLVRVVGHAAGVVSTESTQHVRDKFGLAASERLVLVGTGFDGIGKAAEELRSVLERIQTAARAPILMLVVCGRSDSAYRIFAPLAGTRGLVRTRVVARLDHADWLDALLLCSDRDHCPGLCITKPGGSTIAEIVAAGARMLGLMPFPWEQVNLDHAVSYGLAESINIADLADAVARVLTSPPPPLPEPPTWPNAARLALNALLTKAKESNA